MFTSKEVNKKINRIHEKFLRLVLNNHQSTLDEMRFTHVVHTFLVHDAIFSNLNK